MTERTGPNSAETLADLQGRVRDSFDRQAAMATLGVAVGDIQPGVVVLELPYRADLTQQHGFLHAGVVSTVLDSACGYAAFSLMPPTAAVLTVEFKINLMAPAQGTLLRATGTVIKSGRTITVCEGTADMFTPNRPPVAVARMQATIMSLPSTDRITH